MKPTSKIVIFILAILTSMASAQAQSPSEQLSQMVEQLQKTPTDSALREKIIKLAQTVKPAPAVPEEAQRREGRAKFAFKSAKSNDDYLSAAREYEEAVRVAPWIPGYYSDLCTIYEKAEKYVEAKRNCEISLIAATDPAQVNEIKQRIAGLEFGIEKANSPQAREERRKAEERLRPSVEGKWVRDRGIGFHVVRNGERFAMTSYTIDGEPSSWFARNIVADNHHLRFTLHRDVRGENGKRCCIHDLTLSPSGNELTGTVVSTAEGPGMNGKETFTRVR